MGLTATIDTTVNPAALPSTQNEPLATTTSRKQPQGSFEKHNHTKVAESTRMLEMVVIFYPQASGNLPLTQKGPPSSDDPPLFLALNERKNREEALSSTGLLRFEVSDNPQLIFSPSGTSSQPGPTYS